MLRGYEIYRGPSMLDGAPIVAVLTLRSGNVKTGNMAQLWIMPDNGKPPHKTLADGSDASVCGDCRHRGDGKGKQRSCYVTLFQGPRSVWQAWWNGTYPSWQGETIGKNIRFGAWGDPAALPVDVLRRLQDASTGHTGYTHQWAAKRGAYTVNRMLLMASADSLAEKATANARGWRTFRVTDRDDLQPDEIWCPATPEGGKRTVCDSCRLCQGAQVRAKNIAVRVHGSGAKNFSRHS